MQRERSSQDFTTLALGLAATAAVAGVVGYLFAGERGMERRTVLRSRAQDVRRSLSARMPSSRGAVTSDREIERRIRRRLQRVSSHPHAITVHAEDGIATLYGDVLEHEIDDVVTSVAVVPGVREVRNQLELHERPDIAALSDEHGGLQSLQEWSTPQIIAGIAGTALVAYGVSRRDTTGAMLAVVGGACIAGSLNPAAVMDAASGVLSSAEDRFAGEEEGLTASDSMYEAGGTSANDMTSVTRH